MSSPPVLPSPPPRCGVMPDAEITLPSFQKPELTNVFLFKPGEGPIIAMPGLPTARNVSYGLTFSSSFFFNSASTFPVRSPSFPQIISLLLSCVRCSQIPVVNVYGIFFFFFFFFFAVYDRYVDSWFWALGQ